MYRFPCLVAVMDSLAAFNLLEAAWWTAMAVVCGISSRGRWKTVGRVAMILFLLFAASDVIESQTGAWWNPPWLAVLKGFCIAGLIGCGVWSKFVLAPGESPGADEVGGVKRD